MLTMPRQRNTRSWLHTTKIGTTFEQVRRNASLQFVSLQPISRNLQRLLCGTSTSGGGLVLERSGKCMEVCTQLSYPPRFIWGDMALFPCYLMMRGRTDNPVRVVPIPWPPLLFFGNCCVVSTVSSQVGNVAGHDLGGMCWPVPLSTATSSSSLR